jgi:hypothetical protein
MLCSTVLRSRNNDGSLFRLVYGWLKKTPDPYCERDSEHRHFEFRSDRGRVESQNHKEIEYSESRIRLTQKQKYTVNKYNLRKRKREGVIGKLKEWECVQVNHHKDIGRVIQEWEQKGWRLHTYQAMGTPTIANHYLLFEKGE